MKKAFTISLLFLLASLCHANLTISRVEPAWSAPQPALAPVDSTLKPYFKDARYSDEGLPYFYASVKLNSQTKIGDISVKLDSCKFENCSQEESLLLQGANLADSVAIEYGISNGRGQKYLDINLLPLIQKDGTYKKLTSAVLRIETKPSVQLRSTEDLAARYKNTSKLASGRWVKISVPSTGIYKLTYEDIAAMGFDNPADVAIYGYGGGILEENFRLLESLARAEDDLPETPIYTASGSDGVFSPGDYILFYAQGPDKEYYDADEGRFFTTQNYYSNYGCYFVTTQSGGGKKIEQTTLPEQDEYLEIYDGLMHHFIISEETNLLKSGRRWYGYRFSQSAPNRQFTLPFRGIDTSEPVMLDVELMGYSTSSNSFSLQFDGGTSQSISVSRITNTSYQVGVRAYREYEFACNSTNNPTLSINYSGSASTDYGYIMSINANAVCELNLTGGFLNVYNPYNRGLGIYARYNISGADSNTAIWNISDPLEISSPACSVSGGIARFTANHALDERFLAVNTAYGFPTPTVVGAVANQNLHALEQCDMVIVAPEEYLSAAQTLAQAHRSNSGAVVHVVTPTQVYNEFSSGTPDATAIRWMMKMFYDRSIANNSKMPQALMFIGRAIYDNRGIENTALPQLSYQSSESLNEIASYISDDYFCMLDDNEGARLTSERMDIGVGRLPVNSAAEAEGCVNKIIAYMNNSNYGTWRNTFTFVGDDGDNNEHSEYIDDVAELTRERNKTFALNKIYMDNFIMEQATTGASYPGVNERLKEDLAAGTLVFSYMGHGGANNLAHEQILSRDEASLIICPNPALWITAGCDIGRMDNPELNSLGMVAMTNPNGGGIGVLTTGRVVYSSNNRNLCMRIFNYLVPDENDYVTYTSGMAIAQGKGDYNNDTNKMKYMYFGDPLITLSYPDYKVITESINELESSAAQMQALGITTMKGQVEDRDGNKLEDFNGSVNIHVYDKRQSVSTLSNRGNEPFVYEDFTNTLFRGVASVENGSFSTVFMVPKDINYSDGTGRIEYYAYNAQAGTDANGYDEDFSVGGTAEGIVQATEGPQIRMYINTPSFVSGQSVNPSPVFYAHLYDEYGINTIGNGIGHNLSLKLNNGDPVNVNDYYTANLDDYTSGSVKYNFHDLPDGTYELTFKAWNMQNVSSQQSLSFVVDQKAKPSILDFYATPNPARDYVDLVLVYDRPDNVSDIEFFVYDVAGRLCFKTGETVSTEGTYTATWDLTSGSAGRANTGIYLAKAKVTSEEGTETSQTVKILILRQ